MLNNNIIEVRKFLEKHKDKTNFHISELLRKEGLIMTPDAVRKRRARYALQQKLSPAELVTQDIKAHRDRKVRSVSDKKYKLLIDQVEELEALVDAVRRTKEVSSYAIPEAQARDYEATAVVLASDWHSEEEVVSSSVNGLNEFNLDVSDVRMDLFFTNVTKLIRHSQKSTKIKTLVLALLGDFISGSIHEELAETNLLPPADALIRVQNKIASGIEYILKHSEVAIILPCHSGNHARMTKKPRFAAEKGNSLEYIMFHNLANHFRGNARVKFLISPGYLSYVDISGYVIRFHHGHSIKFGGGIGGIFIPVFKAISQWQKGRRADLDAFGHFHQFRDGGNFVCNGSLIGYNAYAIAGKFEFERPKQAFFLVNHERREKTDVCPIWLD